MKIPVSRPLFTGLEARYANQAIVNGDLSGTFGEFISRFENNFSKYCECNFGISTMNGTTAIHLALATLGIKAGDEVLVSSLTNMATFFAVVYQGAIPIPIDIELDTWNLNPELLEKKITKKTKAILVVHLFGHPVDMDPVLAIARKYKLYVVEDAAQAHGAEYKGKKVGSLGDVGCFSFYANKVITTGEGGMIVTNSEGLASRARSLKSLGYGRKNKFMHEVIGFNYRMTNVQAAIGTAQLENIDFILKRKRDIADFYIDHLSDIQELKFPVEKNYAKNVYWMFHIVLGESFAGRRDLVTNLLKEKGIETRESFIPGNMQKLFIDAYGFREADCPVANNVGLNGFYLPSGPNISKDELQYVVYSLRDLFLNI